MKEVCVEGVEQIDDMYRTEQKEWGDNPPPQVVVESNAATYYGAL